MVNIRTKLGLDLLYHVDGKQNPADVGTRPELITAESVKPGSVWLKGTDWMKLSIDKAKESGVIKLPVISNYQTMKRRFSRRSLSMIHLRKKTLVLLL